MAELTNGNGNGNGSGSGRTRQDRDLNRTASSADVLGLAAQSPKFFAEARQYLAKLTQKMTAKTQSGKNASSNKDKTKLTEPLQEVGNNMGEALGANEQGKYLKLLDDWTKRCDERFDDKLKQIGEGVRSLRDATEEFEQRKEAFAKQESKLKAEREHFARQEQEARQEFQNQQTDFARRQREAQESFGRQQQEMEAKQKAFLEDFDTIREEFLHNFRKKEEKLAEEKAALEQEQKRLVKLEEMAMKKKAANEEKASRLQAWEEAVGVREEGVGKRENAAGEREEEMNGEWSTYAGLKNENPSGPSGEDVIVVRVPRDSRGPLKMRSTLRQPFDVLLGAKGAIPD